MKHDYAALGLKCGLEIHQQLEGKKLFCNCPTTITKEKPDFEIIRRLKASAGEEGSVDKAALHEQKKSKYFVYQGYNDLTCSVELDEEPPLPLNQDALQASLQLAKLLNCVVADEIHVMRKIVIDGSNTTGFQRTMLIGTNGFLEVNGKNISIATLCLEEEACQIIERKNDHDVYNLSRLGIPLIEIATGPDITTPEDARDVAAKIGMILRSISICKRGIGSIRQDVNLSIKGGARVEIKGFQDLKSIPKVMDLEIDRQLKTIKKGETLVPEVRKAEDDYSTSFLRPMPGGARMYPETDIPSFKTDHSKITNIKTIEQKAIELADKHILSKEIADEIIRKGIDIERFIQRHSNIDPKFISETIINAPKEIKKRFGKELSILEHIDEVLSKASSGEIPRSAVFEVLAEIAHGKKPDYTKYKGISDDVLDEEIGKIVKDNKDASIQALMGLVMAKFRGKIEGKKAMDLLKKHKGE